MTFYKRSYQLILRLFSEILNSNTTSTTFHPISQTVPGWNFGMCMHNFNLRFILNELFNIEGSARKINPLFRSSKKDWGLTHLQSYCAAEFGTSPFVLFPNSASQCHQIRVRHQSFHELRKGEFIYPVVIPKILIMRKNHWPSSDSN